MSEQEIKQRAEEYANKVNKFAEDESIYLAAKDGYVLGAHSRDEEIEKLESLLDKAVQMLRETYSGSDFFCERLQEIPEEDLHCKIYCDKDDIRYDCVLRYLKHYKKGE